MWTLNTMNASLFLHVMELSKMKNHKSSKKIKPYKRPQSFLRTSHQHYSHHSWKQLWERNTRNHNGETYLNLHQWGMTHETGDSDKEESYKEGRAKGATDQVDHTSMVETLVLMGMKPMQEYIIEQKNVFRNNNHHGRISGYKLRGCCKLDTGTEAPCSVATFWLLETTGNFGMWRDSTQIYHTSETYKLGCKHQPCWKHGV